MLKLGDTAPDFAVGDTTLSKILKEGSAVVFFFPKVFTPGCTREAGGFGRDYEAFRKAGAEVIGVSADTQEDAERFRASLKLPFPLLGNSKGDVLKAYKVRWPLLSFARRVTYVIGRDAKITRVFESQFDADGHVTQACEAVGVKREA